MSFFFVERKNSTDWQSWPTCGQGRPSGFENLRHLFFLSSKIGRCMPHAAEDFRLGEMSAQVSRQTSWVSRARDCFTASHGDRRRPTPQPSHNTYTASFSDPQQVFNILVGPPQQIVQQIFRIHLLPTLPVRPLASCGSWLWVPVQDGAPGHCPRRGR